MALKRVLSTKVSENNYIKMQDFLGMYNAKTGKNLTMSMLKWEAIRFFVNYTIKILIWQSKYKKNIVCF